MKLLELKFQDFGKILIEPQWNVDYISIQDAEIIKKILIEPQWNVDMDREGFYEVVKYILIEPQWNVDSDVQTKIQAMIVF